MVMLVFKEEKFTSFKPTSWYYAQLNAVSFFLSFFFPSFLGVSNNGISKIFNLFVFLLHPINQVGNWVKYMLD